MGAGPGPNLASKDAGYRHLLDPTKTWYNNRRCDASSFTFAYMQHVKLSYSPVVFNRLITLNAWLVLLYVIIS